MVGEGGLGGSEEPSKVIRCYTGEIIEWCKSKRRWNTAIRSSSAIQQVASMAYLSCT